MREFSRRIWTPNARNKVDPPAWHVMLARKLCVVGSCYATKSTPWQNYLVGSTICAGSGINISNGFLGEGSKFRVKNEISYEKIYFVPTL